MNERMVGADRVVVRDDGLSIYAPAMDGWRVTQHRRAAVHFAGVRYQLVSAEPCGPRLIHYRLVRWSDTGLSSAEIEYDEEYVRARDSFAVEHAERTRSAYLLVPLYPVLGFVWTDARLAFRERYGFGRRAVAFSFALQFFAILLIGTWVFTLFLPPGFWLLSIALTIDLGMRWSSSLRDVEPYGLLEWMFRRR